MFLTYAHYTPQGRLFYIGKGSNERRAHYFSSRNNYWHNIVNKYGYSIEILAKWKTNKEASSHEVLLISCFKDMGYELANLTNGGEGCANPTEETKAKIAASLTGKKRSKEVCEKLSKSHTGKKLSKEHKAKISASLIGFKRSKENCEKLKARRQSEESKKKISEAIKLHWKTR